MISVLETGTVSINSLRPYASNAKLGDTDLIVASLKAHGQFRALVVNRPTMEILAGTHTWMALHEAGASDVLVHFVDVDSDEAARINLVDNKAARAGAFDDGLLLAQLESLGSLEGTGYSQKDLEKLLADTAAAMNLDDKGVCPECQRPL